MREDDESTMTDPRVVEVVRIFGGVDTHADTHTVAAVDAAGQLLGHATFAATVAGYRRLLAWLRGQAGPDGEVAKVGVEGTGSYGAGLARFLTAEGVGVVEVDRPDRRTRRRRGKSDPIDAEAAARAVLAGVAAGTPKTRDGIVEAIRVLRVARRGAVKARTAALNTLAQTVICAPEPLRTKLAGLRGAKLVDACAALRPTHNPTHNRGDRAEPAKLADPIQATKLALRRLAQRCRHLDTEITDADTDLKTLIQQAAPALLDQFGVGIEVAGQLLVTAGDNPDRLHTDAAFAALCGTSPVPASSGRTDRHRLNRGGDRHANAALYTVVITRLRYHQPTRDYAARRRAQGLTSKETIRCLKRYVARELLPLIRAALEPRTAPRTG
jgi:transposase